MKKIKANTKIFFRGFGVMLRVAPTSLVTVFQFSLRAIVPFINIYFTSVILLELTEGQNVVSLVQNIAIAVGLNFVLKALQNALAIQASRALYILWNEELNEVSRAMLALDFETLESTETQKKLALLKEYRQQNGSSITISLEMIANWAQGLIGIGVAFYFLAPLFPILFSRTGDDFLQSPWFSATVVGSVVLALVAVLLISTKTNKIYHKLSRTLGRRSRIFWYYTDMINDYNAGKEIRIFQAQDMIKKHATQEYCEHGMKLHKKMSSSQSFSAGVFVTIGALVGCGVYVLIGTKGLLGFFDVGSLVRYVGAFLQILNCAITIGYHTGILARAIPGLHHYFEIVDMQAKVASGSENPKGRGNQPIVFDNVTFHYPNTERYALKNISMTIRPGEKLAIVGENGSGKTTFVKLLTRMYSPSMGEIRLGGQNTLGFDNDSFQRIFGVVFQDFQLFAYPLGENVAASGVYSSQAVGDCLVSADFSQRLSRLEQGLETILYKDIDEEGVEISGGEAQKIALARALHTKADILILDEPTAALDPVAEFKLYQKFNSLVENKTAIYISHRLSSCRFCDRIAVFDKGELVQLGTHEELVKDKKSKYYELWMAQAQYYV